MIQLKLNNTSKVIFGTAMVTFCLTLYHFTPNNVLSPAPPDLWSSSPPEPDQCNDSLEASTKVTFEECGCNRTLKITSNNLCSLNTTTCSQSAYFRGPNQKVIAYSIYGNLSTSHSQVKGYFDGIEGNLDILQTYYPGWVMRLYHEFKKNTEPYQKLCSFWCQYPHFDMCDVTDLPRAELEKAPKMFPMNWRYLPTLDPQVDWYLSRDLDSRYSDREIVAVKEWLNSDKTFHIMRDNPAHKTEILGGEWGTKLNLTRQNWAQTWQKAFKDSLLYSGRSHYGADQNLLTKYVWPWVKNQAMSHDSYLCLKYPNTQPFPTKRLDGPNNFVASVVYENHTLTQECPKECRPMNHQDWLTC